MATRAANRGRKQQANISFSLRFRQFIGLCAGQKNQSQSAEIIKAYIDEAHQSRADRAVAEDLMERNKPNEVAVINPDMFLFELAESINPLLLPVATLGLGDFFYSFSQDRPCWYSSGVDISCSREETSMLSGLKVLPRSRLTSPTLEVTVTLPAWPVIQWKYISVRL